MNLQPAQPSDVPIILGFIKDLAEFKNMAHEVTATEQDLHESLFGPSKMIEVLLAVVDGKKVGYVLFFRTYSAFLTKPDLFVDNLYLTPAARGQGAGKALIQAVAKLAMERGCERVEWDALNWNEPSIKFFKKLGARPLSDMALYRLEGDALTKFATS